MSVSKFKATCLAVIETISQTGETLIITKHGKPLAQIVPLPKNTSDSAFGAMAAHSREIEDILEPLPEEDWDVLR